MGVFSMNSQKTALLLALAVLCHANNQVIGRAVHDTISPVGLSFWRWVISALMLLPLVATALPKLMPLYLQHWKVLGCLGALIIGSSTLVLVGLNYTTAINASVIFASQPTIIALLCWLFLGEQMRTMQYLGLAIALLGILSIVLRGDLAVLANLNPNSGDLMVLAAMFGFAAYGINIRHLPKGFHVTESLIAIIVLGSLLLLPFYLLETTLVRPAPFNTRLLLVALAIALLSSVPGLLMWTRGNQLIGARQAAVYFNLHPLFGALLSFVFLGETIELHHLYGALLVGSGMWLVIRM